MTLDFKNFDSNEIINNLDELIAQGHTIDEIVSALDDIRIVANYGLLLEKGATNIDLTKIRDKVNPNVVLNNIEVFKKANVPVDVVKIIYEVADEDPSLTQYSIEGLTDMGADPQILADKYASSSPLGRFFIFKIEDFLNIGAHIDADKLIDRMLGDPDFLEFDYYGESDIPILKRAGASIVALNKLPKRV